MVKGILTFEYMYTKENQKLPSFETFLNERFNVVMALTENLFSTNSQYIRQSGKNRHFSLIIARRWVVAYITVIDSFYCFYIKRKSCVIFQHSPHHNHIRTLFLLFWKFSISSSSSMDFPFKYAVVHLNGGFVHWKAYMKFIYFFPEKSWLPLLTVKCTNMSDGRCQWLLHVFANSVIYALELYNWLLMYENRYKCFVNMKLYISKNSEFYLRRVTIYCGIGSVNALQNEDTKIKMN